MNKLKYLDLLVTKFFNKIIGKTSLIVIFKLLGQIPYQLYIIPGLFISFIYMWWFKSYSPVQVHILPYTMAYSLSGYLSHEIKRKGPNCEFLDSCNLNTFPSRDITILFSVITSSILYLYNDQHLEKKLRFLNINFNNPLLKKNITIMFLMSSILYCFYRLSMGYNYFTDIIFSIFFGFIIGYTSWKTSEIIKYSSFCGEKEMSISKTKDLISNAILNSNYKSQINEDEESRNKLINKIITTKYSLVCEHKDKMKFGSSWNMGDSTWQLCKVFMSLLSLILLFHFMIFKLHKLAAQHH